VKFFSYFTTPRDVQKAYLKGLKEVAKKIIKQHEKNIKNNKVVVVEEPENA
jgi:hypothetical protein